MKEHPKAKPQRPVRRWVWNILFILLMLASLHVWQTRHMETGELPAIAGWMVDGSRYVAEDWEGRPRLIHFWATWCPVCRLEMSALDSVSQDHAVLSVAMRSGDGAAVQAFLDTEQVRMPVLLDEQGRLAATFGVTGVPASFIVDAQDRIRFVTMGYTTEWGLRLRLWVAGLGF